MSKPQCTFKVKGILTKDSLYILLDHINQMKTRGFYFTKHERIDGNDNEVFVDYELEKQY